MGYENLNKGTLINILTEKDEMLKKIYLEREKLSYFANTDPMTGVLNRRSGFEIINRKINSSKNNDKNIIVCFVDIDKLKMINDTFGHAEGDKIILSSVKILKKSIRKTDFIIRIGGDEFLLVFPKTTMKEVNSIWYKICGEVEALNNINNKYNLSLSYGFYEYSWEMKNKMSIDDIIKKADSEMYKNKNKKRGIL